MPIRLCFVLHSQPICITFNNVLRTVRETAVTRTTATWDDVLWWPKKGLWGVIPEFVGPDLCKGALFAGLVVLGLYNSPIPHDQTEAGETNIRT